MKVRTINFLVMFSVFLLQTIDNFLREKRLSIGGFSGIKNVLLAVTILFYLYQLYQLKRRKMLPYLFKDELKSILGLAVSFAILSVSFMLRNNGFEFITVTGIIRLVIPVVVAFAVLNLMGLSDIYRLMSYLLILMFLGYLCTIANLVSIENIKSISFLKSSSPFESTYFSPSAMAFCLFFCYFRKNKSLTLLSVLFTVLTFKRMMVLYAVFLLLFGDVCKKRKEVPQWMINLFEIVFLVLSLFYIALMSGAVSDVINKYLGIQVVDFSMGRSYFMQLILLGNFKSLGFMTSTLGFRSMEMDIPMIYTEMGVLSVIAVIYFFTKIAKQNWYNFFAVIFCLFQILTSHWLDITYFWIVAYITIGCVAYKNNDSTFQRRKFRIGFRRKNLQI